MTVEDIANKLNEYISWLSSRRLEDWWPVLIAVATLFIVLIVVLRRRSRRKVLPTITQLRDIIGIELADDKTNNGRTDRTEKNRSANVQNELDITDNMQAWQPRAQKVYEIVPDNEPFHLKVADSSRARQHPIQKVSEIAAFNKQFQYVKSEQGQSEKTPEEGSEQDLKSKKHSQPFDIAEFSKSAISRQQRLRSGIYNEYSDLDED